MFPIRENPYTMEGVAQAHTRLWNLQSSPLVGVGFDRCCAKKGKGILQQSQPGKGTDAVTITAPKAASTQQLFQGVSQVTSCLPWFEDR